jgi:hypothetical protein
METITMSVTDRVSPIGRSAARWICSEVSGGTRRRFGLGDESQNDAADLPKTVCYEVE